MVWRWDQGRSAYFQFDSIKRIATILIKYNGANMKMVDVQLRKDLMKATGLPFAPSTYTIKRNYKRVFECMMIASYISDRLIISEIGRAVADPNSELSNVDSYLYEVERRFRYPYPAFNNYNDVKKICFPFLAILKFLLSRAIISNSPKASISLQDVGAFLIANEVSGLEDINFYRTLQSNSKFNFESYGSNDQKRQVREMMHFIGQHSFIESSENHLTLIGLNIDDCQKAFNSLVPLCADVTSTTPIDDFMKITSYTKIKGEFEDLSNIEDFSVQEGKKVFKTHFLYERDSKLRKEFIKRNPNPICDVCGKDMHIIYPWTENMLEIHHIHPLSSYSDTSSNHESNLKDIVGICPSCHRAIHLYYKKHLIEENLQDFESKKRAEEIYNEAKKIVRKNV